jgi:hypothetical protein
MTDIVSSRLVELEVIIERGIQTFAQVGMALAEIRDARLYRDQGFGTFEDYCRDRWRFERRTAYNYIVAAAVVQNVPTSAQAARPSVSQAVELAVLEPDQQRDLAARINFSTITVRELRDEIRAMRSACDEWYSPPTIVSRAVQVLGTITLDPCSPESPTVPAQTFYTRADDGLSRPWTGRVYMNPPYQQLQIWVEKLLCEYREGNIDTALALLPSRTDRPWFQMLHDHPVCFLAKRLRFSGSADNAPFGSCVVYLGTDIKKFSAAFSDIGDIWIRWAEQPPTEGR